MAIEIGIARQHGDFHLTTPLVSGPYISSKGPSTAFVGFPPARYEALGSTNRRFRIASRPTIIGNSIPSRLVRLNSIGQQLEPICRFVVIMYRSSRVPLEFVTHRRSLSGASQTTGVTSFSCIEWTLKRIHCRPSTMRRLRSQACNAEVFAPVSSLALIAKMPKYGKDTHSRQPTIRLRVTPELTIHLTRVNYRYSAA